MIRVKGNSEISSKLSSSSLEAIPTLIQSALSSRLTSDACSPIFALLVRSVVSLQHALHAAKLSRFDAVREYLRIAEDDLEHLRLIKRSIPLKDLSAQIGFQELAIEDTQNALLSYLASGAGEYLVRARVYYQSCVRSLQPSHQVLH